MKRWDENGLDVQVQYTNPLQVGRGNDKIATSLRNPALFAPTSGADPLTKEEGTSVAAAPPQVPKGVDEEELTKDASTACKGFIALSVGMIIIQLWV